MTITSVHSRKCSHRANNASDDRAIAIIGMSARVPGAHGLDDFWDLLCDGANVITDVPSTRFSVDNFYDGSAPSPGKIITRKGGFLENIDGFDADFFAISPREAEAMDPQQRLLLECAWEALEDAGQERGSLAGSRNGVFVGCDGSNYWELQSRGLPTIYGVMGGGARSAIAGRLSSALNLTGPSLAVDTACSSSLIVIKRQQRYGSAAATTIHREPGATRSSRLHVVESCSHYC